MHNLFNLKNEVTLCDVLHTAFELGHHKGFDPSFLFDNAKYHGHDGLQTVTHNGHTYQVDYDYIVLSDPDWGDADKPYIVAYRYKITTDVAQLYHYELSSY